MSSEILAYYGENMIDFRDMPYGYEPSISESNYVVEQPTFDDNDPEASYNSYVPPISQMQAIPPIMQPPMQPPMESMQPPMESMQPPMQSMQPPMQSMPSVQSIVRPIQHIHPQLPAEPQRPPPTPSRSPSLPMLPSPARPLENTIQRHMSLTDEMKQGIPLLAMPSPGHGRQVSLTTDSSVRPPPPSGSSSSSSSSASASSSGQTQVNWIKSKDLLDMVLFLYKESKVSSFPSAIIIDTRNSNEYNGWKELNAIMASSTTNNNSQQQQMGSLSNFFDAKNGHVSDSHNLDADWLSLFDPALLNVLIGERMGLKQKNNNRTVATGDMEQPVVPVILYDTRKSRLEKVKNYLISNFQLNTIYMCQIDNSEELLSVFSKSNETSSLFFQEPFYDMLFSAEVLYAILRPYNDTYNTVKVRSLIDYKLFDVSQGGPDKHYERSHIPTALHMNTNDLEESKHLRLRKNKTELAKLLLSYGIAPNNTEMIILYGNPEPMASYRAALLLKWMGVKDVHVLNGGYRSWLIKSYPTESRPNRRAPLRKELEKNIKLYEEQSLAATSPISYIIEHEYMSDIVKNYDLFSEQYILVDIRTYEEHIGEISGSSLTKAKGRLPGSLWGRAGGSPNQLDDYRNPDMSMRSGAEILKMWDELGIDYKTKHIIFYCSDGWRSSEVIFYAELMGLYKISLYEGGWLEWSNNPNNSVQIGPSADTESISFETRFTQPFSTNSSPQPRPQPPPLLPLPPPQQPRPQPSSTTKPIKSTNIIRSTPPLASSSVPLPSKTNKIHTASIRPRPTAHVQNNNRFNLSNALFFEVSSSNNMRPPSSHSITTDYMMRATVAYSAATLVATYMSLAHVLIAIAAAIGGSYLLFSLKL
jgi:3-mercaptopyruvate sulfurtransferase SseA